MCLVSVGLVFAVEAVDRPGLAQNVPNVSTETIEVLLDIIAASMLVIATFAVGSMVAAYSSASATATPRSFQLVIADDVSQNALSSFIGAFIYSIVALIALERNVYGVPGRFALFCLTLAVFVVVILTFLRWVDCIARLGRLGSTIEKVETATAKALEQRRSAPTLGCLGLGPDSQTGRPVYAESVGYLQRIEVRTLQSSADEAGVRIAVAALPGAFTAPDCVLAYVRCDVGDADRTVDEKIREAFLIGDARTFDGDPRFGLLVLSEIAGRALSPAVNDPGTAIMIIDSLVRLFVDWSRPAVDSARQVDVCDRVEVLELEVCDMFDDAFTSIARDGASAVEVAARLQRAFRSLAEVGNPYVRAAATAHSRLALERARAGLTLAQDVQVVRDLAAFSEPVSPVAL